MYEGSLDGSRVCIKRVKAYVQDGSQKADRVRYWRRGRFPHSPPLTKPIDLLSRSHNVEKLETPKCSTATRYYYHLLPTRFESDVWGDLPEYMEKHLDADRLVLVGMLPLCSFRACFRCQLSDVTKGLYYLHSRNVIHGDLKGVRRFPKSCSTSPLTSYQPNILVDDSGHARVADFGLAAVAQNFDSMSVSAQRGHTLRWSAPEVLYGGRCSKEADIFAFAMIMIEVRYR